MLPEPWTPITFPDSLFAPDVQKWATPAFVRLADGSVVEIVERDIVPAGLPPGAELWPPARVVLIRVPTVGGQTVNARWIAFDRGAPFTHPFT